MDTIAVKKVSETVFLVTVESRSLTTHEVTVPAGYYQKLTKGKVTPETLVEKSFEFLLQREPNTSILSRFELPVIGHYFPAYENKITDMISGI